MKSNAITRSLSRLLGGAPDTATHDAKADRGTKNQLAMLIDTENIPAAQMNEIMSRAKQYGEITHRLAFGPTTNGNWAQTRLKHAIRWGRQSLVKTGKNSADIELSITAMELLLTDRSIGGFCIVSSDSDFTPLVMRLREADKLVVGFGNQNAAAGFIAACDRFETLRGVQTKQPVSAEPRKEPAAQTKKSVSVEPRKEPAAQTKQPVSPKPKTKPAAQSAKPQSGGKSRRKEFLDLVRRATAKAKHHEGWIHISELGSQIRKLKPEIEYKDYGHKKLILVLESYPDEIETRGPNGRKQIRLRDLGTTNP